MADAEDLKSSFLWKCGFESHLRHQKTVTTDFLTKRSKKNEGEAPKYYVENSHEGIISRETHDLVQNEMNRRSEKGSGHSCGDILSGHLICGDCGYAYGRKLWHSTSKYRRVVWQCNRKFVNEERCQTPHVTENKIKELFVQAVNKMNLNRDEIIHSCGDIMQVLENNHDLDNQKQSIKDELKKVRDDIEKLVVLNAAKVLDQKVYARQYDGLIMAYREV